MEAVLSLKVLTELSFSIPNFLDPLGGHAYYYFWVPVILICGGAHMISLWSNIADRNMKMPLRLWNQILLLRMTKSYHCWDPAIILYGQTAQKDAFALGNIMASWWADWSFLWGKPVYILARAREMRNW